MRLFSKLYAYAMQWSRHKHAPIYLAGVSFIEASVFPIPPDVMLAPMSLAKPERAWWYATLTTLFSVLGALFGYVIGMFFFHWIAPLLTYFGYWQSYQQAQAWFENWGGWVMFVAGVSPIPFKLFTIGAGALHLNILPFIIGSFIGRALRFYLVAGLMRWGGAAMDKWIQKFIDWIGWILLVLCIMAYGIYRWQF